MSASGLSDVLRDLAGQTAGSTQKQSSPPPAAGRPARARRPASTSPSPRPRMGSPDYLKAAAAPVLALVAGLLLVPGGWAVAVLTGQDVVLADRANADRMALAMLACLPLAAIMLAAAGYLVLDLRHARSAAATRRR